MDISINAFVTLDGVMQGPGGPDEDNSVAAVLNGGKKYVVSTTLSDDDAAWGDTTVIRGDVIESVRRLKQDGPGELQVHGSWRLVRTLHDAGLVDVVRLLQFPVVVGSGKRVFPAHTPSRTAGNPSPSRRPTRGEP